MVLHKHGDRLYDGLTETLLGHLQSLSTNVLAASEDQFLTELGTRWADHKMNMTMIRDILMYMVRRSGQHHTRTLNARSEPLSPSLPLSRSLMKARLRPAVPLVRCTLHRSWATQCYVQRKQHSKHGCFPARHMTCSLLRPALGSVRSYRCGTPGLWLRRCTATHTERS
jgi:hypothetical protein